MHLYIGKWKKKTNKEMTLLQYSNDSKNLSDQLCHSRNRLGYHISCLSTNQNQETGILPHPITINYTPIEDAKQFYFLENEAIIFLLFSKD